MIAAGPLPWNKFDFDFNGFHFLDKFLITGKVNDLVTDPANPGFSFASIGALLVILGIVALLLSFAPQLHVLRRIIGILGIAIAVLFVVQLITGQVSASIGDVFKDLGPGAYAAVVGGILVLVG